ncbi:Quinolinate synthase A [Gammaproteobacteria bacterium]
MFEHSDFSSYLFLDDAICDERIRAAKERLDDKLIILSHHYQREEVFKHADYTGDSLKLARKAAYSDARYLVFCGVHFMVEVASILSFRDQMAILPDLSAGCSMADMADLGTVERVWKELGTLFDPEQEITPVTYINSSADLKAFCGRHKGIVCTSSNARAVLDWAFSQRRKVLFFPDQHLGRNTGYGMGIPLEQMVVWDANQPMGALTNETIQNAKILLWNGFCSVHQVFQVAHIDDFRAQYPEGKVISHPECSFEVCQKSDEVGSTEYILSTVRESAPGTRWLVGTEFNLVQRLQEEQRPEGKNVHFMAPTLCKCPTMHRIDPQNLLWVLENLVQGLVCNRIVLPDSVRDPAHQALQRMMMLSS